MIYLLTIFAQGWGHYHSDCPHGFWAGVCSAGRVGGQVTQSGSTRIPSPAVAVVAAVGCTYRAGSVDHWHGILGKIDKLRGIPEGMRYRSGVATSSEHQIVAWR